MFSTKKEDEDEEAPPPTLLLPGEPPDEPDTDTSEWIPIKKKVRPTFGPRNRPKGYSGPPPLDKGHLAKLSHLAEVSVMADGGRFGAKTKQQPNNRCYKNLKK